MRGIAMTRHYVIYGYATEDYYLVHVQDARWWLYPPGTFRLPRVVEGTSYGLSYYPGSGQEVTARWPWLSALRARRAVAKVERRVARTMRRIYGAQRYAERQGQ
jgi:hypothetical protein